ncbi:hypothetical protein [Amycolatopsis thermophila]|uniref:Uncharacterized protein n=1 Tax=Amycolatopsis thermophila TaxID=206084 RepID=A0ABU0F5W4_9PSEU|nr:hypothetical protein [Amycolatopsis thermophila]MDQ0382981.1 hypothetical protein [Amycolatopsis thermophila]
MREAREHGLAHVYKTLDIAELGVAPGDRGHLPGMAVGTRFGFALGGFAPVIAAALAGKGLTDWVPVAVFTCVCTTWATRGRRPLTRTRRPEPCRVAYRFP